LAVERDPALDLAQVLASAPDQVADSVAEPTASAVVSSHQRC
jgi:hypothetical protein